MDKDRDTTWNATRIQEAHHVDGSGGLAYCRRYLYGMAYGMCDHLNSNRRERLMKDKRCIAKMYDRGHSWSCQNKAKMEHEGEYYCGVHDPIKKKAREDKQYAKWDKELKESQKKHDRANLCVSVLKDFSDKALKDGVVGEMLELARVVRGMATMADITNAADDADVILAKLKAK